MKEPRVHVHKFLNGMTLVAEEMAEVSSAAFVFLVPAGVVYDPEGRTGTAGVLTELVYRGAGELDNRALNDRLDSLGLQRHDGVATLHSSFGGALLCDNLLEALKLHADILRRPQLPPEHFEFCKDLALQSLESIEDDPRHKVSLLVQEQYLPYPFGRPPQGKKEELQALEYKEVKNFWANQYSPYGSILAVAGKFDFESLKKTVSSLFDDWNGRSLFRFTPGPCQLKTLHQPYEGAQVHIGIMYQSVGYEHQDYFKALAAASVLSGGMGSRLFTEVREKRGLCYAVGAGHKVMGPVGAVQCYLGSSPEKAQEALDVTLTELRRLRDGIEQDELDRAKVGLRASLIMQGESSSSRAITAARDYHYLGRVRSLGEVEEAVNMLTVDDVLAHVKNYWPAGFNIVTIGPKELSVPK